LGWTDVRGAVKRPNCPDWTSHLRPTSAAAYLCTRVQSSARCFRGLDLWPIINWMRCAKPPVIPSKTPKTQTLNAATSSSVKSITRKRKSQTVPKLISYRKFHSFLFCKGWTRSTWKQHPPRQLISIMRTSVVSASRLWIRELLVGRKLESANSPGSSD